jgi:SpoVK/Ycf46/Vps4 family AAA+-type ATPase
MLARMGNRSHDPDELDALLRLSIPPIRGDGPFTGEEVRALCREAASLALFNERAAVLNELDKLARRFEAGGKPNTARAVRETMQAIDARLVQPSSGGFSGSR